MQNINDIDYVEPEGNYYPVECTRKIKLQYDTAKSHTFL